MLVNHFLENSARRRPDKTALISGSQRFTYKDIDRSANMVACALRELGIRRQDRVVILLDNCPEAIVALFGVLKAGAIFVLLNATMKARKLNYILNDSGAHTIITSVQKSQLLRGALKGLTDLRHVIWIGDSLNGPIEHDRPLDGHSWREIMNGSNGRQGHAHSNIDLDLATIIYTSGSTGEPKGVMSAHYNVTAAARSISQYLENTEEDIILNVLPLSFDYGLYQVLMTFLFTGTLLLEKSFAYPAKILELLEKERVSGFPIVPTMAAILLQMDNISNFDLRPLRYISNTAAALPTSHIKHLRSTFPHVKVFSMYGLTECKRVSYLPPEFIDDKPNSVGIPMPNEEVFVVNDHGEEVPSGQEGELVVRGSNVMQGYWNAPEETARRFRPGRLRGEALLYTGDIFRRDEDGFLYFVSRKDDLIKTKGERVSPKEIEDVLCYMEGVSEAAVLGVPDPVLGQAIKAIIVLQKGASLNEHQVMRYCTQNLEPFAVPKYIEFKTSLPKSVNGKIDKKQLN